MSCKKITTKSKELAAKLGVNPVYGNTELSDWFGDSQVINADGSPKLVFHGTNVANHFDELRPHINKNEQLGFGIHFAENFDFASECYADKKSGRVFPVYLKIENMLDADRIYKEGSPEFALAHKLMGKKLFTVNDEDGIPCCYLQGVFDRVSPARAEKVIREAGYDGVKYLAIYGGWANPANGVVDIDRKEVSYIVFSPEQIKYLELDEQ